MDASRKQQRLPRSNRFRGNSVEALASFLARKGITLDLRLRGKDVMPVPALINAAYLEGMYIGYMEYGTPLYLHSKPPRVDYGMSLSLDGSYRVRVDRRVFECDPQRAAIVSPSSTQMLELSEHSRRIGVSFARDAVVRQLAVLLGEPARREPIFEPEIDLSSGPGLRLRRVLDFVLDELELGANKVWERELEQLAVTTLLLTVRHDWSERLDRETGRPAPAAVKRAIDYVQSHLDRQITLSDLTAAAGVSGSTLLRHFSSFMGESPLAYVRGQRLRHAREELLRAENGISVTDVAARWGFTHFGRFAAQYRRVFGERPSDTRRHQR
jgi:AraC-like DNA-binding protein